jgi:hypothetical protein
MFKVDFTLNRRYTKVFCKQQNLKNTQVSKLPSIYIFLT